MDKKLNVFEVAVKALDKLQLENSHFLSTDHRIQLVEFFNEQAHQQGIDQYDDITWEWREEW